jgi:hypothetical protein
MDKTQLQAQLILHHRSFIDTVDGLNVEHFERSPNGKWSGGQQLSHICKSTKPLVLATALPVFVLQIAFGKANRPSKSYEALVEKYTAKLADGGKASAPFVPDFVPFSSKAGLIHKLNIIIEKIQKNTDRFSERDLDFCILPHPLLGKITLREMLYFTIHHVQHHHQQVTKHLGSA